MAGLQSKLHMYSDSEKTELLKGHEWRDKDVSNIEIFFRSKILCEVELKY